MAPVYTSPTNVHQAAVQEQLQVTYSRNPAAFPVNRWTRSVPIAGSPAVYYKFTSREARRIPEGDADFFLWPDGQPRPNLLKFVHERIPFETFRRSFDGSVGSRSVNIADWDLMAQYQREPATLAMTARALLATRVATDTANYPTGHFGTATAVGGGVWAGSTPADQFIKKSFDAARLQIDTATGGIGNDFSLMAVMGPNTAQAIGQSTEVQQYITANPVAYPVLQGSSEFVSPWGIPPNLYGFETVVDNTVVNTSKKDADDGTYFFDDPDQDGTQEGYVAFLVVPSAQTQQAIFDNGGIAADPSGRVVIPPDFSSITVATLEDMGVDAEVDEYNRINQAGVTDDVKILPTAMEAAFLVTNCLAA